MKARGRDAERFDVVIVGARCAGSPLAALLAGRGLKVAVLDQVTLPRDTLSSHVKQADSLAFLNRLGVIEQVSATGAPFTHQIDARLEDVRVVARIPERPGDVGGGACIRRVVLDPILADAAAAAGADVRMATTVTGLIEEGGRVTGVRASSGGAERVLRARLVVGADGRSSTVAKLCGARKYNVVPNERAYYWTYFEGADLSAPTSLVLHRWGERFIIAHPADSGLYMAGVSPEATERHMFRRDLEAGFMEHVLSCEPTAEILAGARRVAKIHGIVRFDGYFREASGAGWVLVGDAAHFKDPAAGRGIGDAFLQVEALAPAIVEAIDGPAAELDRAMVRWGRWRDREFFESFWLGVDLGTAGAVPMMMPEVLRLMRDRDELPRFAEVLSHRRRPSQVITPMRAARAVARLLRRRGVDRRSLLRETRRTIGQQARRRWVARRPVFDAESESDANAGGQGHEGDAGAVQARLPIGG